MTQAEINSFIRQTHKNNEIKWIDKGQMNFIVIIDQSVVYKFPKSFKNLQLLKKENEIYKLLKSKVTLNIPTSLELNTKYEYLKLSFVKGQTPTEQQASRLAIEQKNSLAIKLALFIKELNSAELKPGFDKIFINDTNDFYYVEDWLGRIAKFCKEQPNDLSDKYLQLYKKFSNELPYGFCVGDFIAHKDLHEDNMLFNKQNELVGIIDFAEVRYTSIYSELRTVIRFGVEVVEQIIDLLGDLANGAKASDILLFAKVYEMAIIVQNKHIKKELPWRVEQAEYYLRQWGEAASVN